MMSNNTYSNTSSLNNVTTLAKDEELQKFENSFFPAGGAPQLANIPQAPRAPTNFNNVRSRPLNLKTRNWGPKLENGFGGLNRSLYDRPNVFNWDNQPILGERAHLNNNNNVLSSFPSSSTSTTSTSRSIGNNIPSAIAPPSYRDLHNHLVHGRRLRIRNWGYPAEGWSGMNRELYNGGMRLERDIIMNELRYKYGPRPNFQTQPLQQERSISSFETMNLVETVPTTTLIETGPTKVLATTVPVPMLNPPINDGRRYEKLYKRNTNALGSEKGLTKLVKRRGTRRDHLVQPTTAAPMNSFVSAVPYTGATVIQPATLVGESRSIVPTTGIAPYTPVAPMTGFAPVSPSKAEIKRERRVERDQQKLLKKEQRAFRKANKNYVGTTIPLGAPLMSAPMYAAPVATTVLPLQTAAMPVTTSFVGQPSVMPTTGFVGSPALQNATFVGETRTVLSQEATFIAPATTTTMPLTAPVMAPVGVSAMPLDHSHVLAGQLGNAPVKRPRRARKARKGTEQPLYSNIISSTPAPLTTTTITGAPITSGYATTSVGVVDGTTVVQPATLVSETRNIIVDPLVQQQQGMIKQEYIVAPTISPLATGNPLM